MTTNIDENIKSFRQIYSDCSDIKMQEMYLGRDASIKCFVAYIEVTCAGSGINNSAFGRFTSYLEGIDRDQVKEVLDKNQAALSEFAHLHTVREAAQMMLTGDVIFFVDGYPDAFKLPDKGYPALSIQEIDSEKVIRGSNEGFADSIKINTALIRRRLRSTRLKCKEVKKGLRGHSNVDILYVRDLVKPGLVEDVERNLDSYVIDHVGDSGVIEQFAEAKWYSPFPQLQTTKRPDVAVNALIEGRVVVLCDNSPIAIILPTTMNNFLKTADDYYNRTIAASFARLIRYVAAFMSFTLPGLYLAVTNFHTQILPTPLILAFYEARLGCPFPQLIEVLMMELSFELLREAGIRLPGAMGNTIGIVGGLIIGQAAVDANLVTIAIISLTAVIAAKNHTPAANTNSIACTADMQKSIAGKILRFHVLANSDSEADQNVKKQVRDAVGAYIEPYLLECENIEETRATVNDHMDEIIAVSKETLAANGFTYGASAELTHTDFPEKTYGDYTFPEGNYEALEITLGDGAGHNWWCVLYPNMCFRGSVYEVVEDEAKENLKEVLTPDEYKSIFDSGKYEIKLKILDIFR